MIAVDSGFLFALANQRDRWHVRARSFAGTSAEGWVCTWPVLTEACHLLLRDLPPRFAAGLMDDVARGAMDVWSPPAEAMGRIGMLMHKYADLPMDLADASLVLLAEHLGHGRILSTDQRDFGAYRWKNHEPFHNLLEETP
jgi:predicted nucleic acid-binding protein